MNNEALFEAIRELHGAVDHLAAVVKEARRAGRTHVIPKELKRQFAPVHEALIAAGMFLDEARGLRPG